MSSSEDYVAKSHVPGSDWIHYQKSSCEDCAAKSHVPGSDWTRYQTYTRPGHILQVGLEWLELVTTSKMFKVSRKMLQTVNIHTSNASPSIIDISCNKSAWQGHYISPLVPNPSSCKLFSSFTGNPLEAMCNISLAPALHGMCFAAILRTSCPSIEDGTSKVTASPVKRNKWSWTKASWTPEIEYPEVFIAALMDQQLGDWNQRSGKEFALQQKVWGNTVIHADLILFWFM